MSILDRDIALDYIVAGGGAVLLALMIALTVQNKRKEDPTTYTAECRLRVQPPGFAQSPPTIFKFTTPKSHGDKTVVNDTTVCVVTGEY